MPIYVVSYRVHNPPAAVAVSAADSAVAVSTALAGITGPTGASVEVFKTVLQGPGGITGATGPTGIAP